MPDKDPAKEKMAQRPTRYEQFKMMMNSAAGRSSVNYEGHGRFWETLSLEELQNIKIYGVRMIAPIDEGTFDDGWKKESGMGAAYVAAPAGANSSAHPTGTTKGSCCNTDDPSGSHSHDSGNCCEPSGSGDSPKYPGRGAASGLIKGLKGEAPFDNSHFPRMPFGGQAMPSENIAFIEQWIDDGCPGGPEKATSEDQPPPSGAIHNGLSVGETAHPPTFNANAYKYYSGELLQRKNLEYLSVEELQKIRYAFQKTIELNQYFLDKRSFDSYARIHGDSCQHGWEQFLPWHRAFLYEFEQNLNDFVPGVAIPYWDWPLPMYNQGKVPKGGKSGIIPTPLRCWLSQEALDTLAKQGIAPKSIKKLQPLVDRLFNSGTELIWEIEELINMQLSQQIKNMLLSHFKLSNPLWCSSRYPGMFYKKNNGNFVKGKDGKPILTGLTGLETQFNHHYPLAGDIERILQIDNWRGFGGGSSIDYSFGMLSMNPHNTGHIWSGGENPEYQKDSPDPDKQPFGVMFQDLTAFFDPIAWHHHSNVDRLFAKWQSLHPGVNPDDLNDVMMPWTYNIRELLNISKLGYEYVIASSLYETNNKTPITKFKSENVDLPEDVLQNHNRAEVRLHRLQRAVNSHYIKVFINSPDANADTLTVDNPKYVGYIARFGHGDCVGGPGHCDVPDENRRKFDKRPRHHNTPTNHVLDATESIKWALANEAQKGIHVNVVALNHDGQMATGQSRLLMDAVSLNFID